MAGPWGDVVRERAGDPGEYHHSKNLMTNMVVGSKSRRESSSKCGEVEIMRRIRATKFWRASGDVLFWASKRAALCEE